MIYELNKCPICGSPKLNQISKLNNDEDIILKYKCFSCDSIVSNEAYLKQKRDDNATIIFKRALQSIIEITADFSDKSTSGTGILLKDNFILTNAHIVSMDFEFALSICGNFKDDINNYNLEIISIDEELDLALLKIENLNYLPVFIEDIPVKTGEKVYAIGNAIGQGLSIVEGIVSDANRIVNGISYIMHTAPVNPGNSGGPLYNGTGKIIGMIASTRKDAKSMSYAIPNSALIHFLKDILR